MQAASSHARRRIRDRLPPGMEGAVAGEKHVGRGQEHGELVLGKAALVAEFVAVVQQVPAIGLLISGRCLSERVGSSQVKRK